MKFTVTMKDPDKLHDAIREAVDEQLKLLDMERDEAESVADLRCQKIGIICQKWFEYGEYLTVEIDTEAKTCTVKERS